MQQAMSSVGRVVAPASEDFVFCSLRIPEVPQNQKIKISPRAEGVVCAPNDARRGPLLVHKNGAIRNTAKVALSTLFTGIEQSWNLYSSI